MKKSILVSIWLAAAILSPAAVAQAQSAPSVGITANLIDGSEFNSLTDPIQRPLLLKFWATWCVACLKEMPAFVDLYRQQGEHVQFLAVNVAVSDPLERVKQAVDQYDLDMPVAYDEGGELWDRFGIIGTPTYVLIDRNGQTLYKSHRHDEELEIAVASVAELSSELAAAEVDDGQVDVGITANATIRDIDGNVVDLAPRSGEVLVAYHFATWCTWYVENSYPELSEICHSFNEGIRELRALNLPRMRMVGFATVYSTDETGVAKFRDEEKIDYPVVYDRNNAFGSAFGVRDFPYLVVTSSSGDVLFSGNQVPSDIGQRIERAMTH